MKESPLFPVSDEIYVDQRPVFTSRAVVSSAFSVRRSEMDDSISVLSIAVSMTEKNSRTSVLTEISITPNSSTVRAFLKADHMIVTHFRITFCVHLDRQIAAMSALPDPLSLAWVEIVRTTTQGHSTEPIVL